MSLTYFDSVFEQFSLLEWLLPKYEEQWNRMLGVFSGADVGPSEITDEDFEMNSCRCGRILEKNTRVR